MTRQFCPQFTESYRLDRHGSLSVGSFHQGNPWCNFPNSTFVASMTQCRMRWKFLKSSLPFCYIKQSQLDNEDLLTDIRASQRRRTDKEESEVQSEIYGSLSSDG